MALKGQLVGIPKPKESILRGRVTQLITGLDRMKARHIREVEGHHARIVKLKESYKKLGTLKAPKDITDRVEAGIKGNISQLIVGLDKMAARHQRELEVQHDRIAVAQVNYEKFLKEQDNK
ncbi:hypothetical protein [Arthrobacter sp. Soil762]|uniref:hypothetical protein n=1 Tax=Arthrobacter sp. Soil762 TaxID=1736401 RepID=UPI0012E3377A|nr:hypothetical protein [Arthrobacter sp. Soil762]